jgi:O-succinylbenzoic acid--CoA ligase
MEGKELRNLIPILAQWSIPQLQENLAVALKGSGAVLSTTQIKPKQVASEIALVVNTSGSTGDAKPVALSSAALIASANASHKFLGATRGNTWSLLLPTTHIAGLNVIIRAITLGSQVIDNRKTEDFVDADFASIVPTQLYKALTLDSKLLNHLRAAKAVLVGGGPVSEKLKKEAADKGVKITTSYGMTEMSGGCVYNQKPLDEVVVKISETGLIQLSGPMIASGYLLANGGLEKFPRSKWFETTDLGEITNGLLTVLGRVDDVIISGGEKIFLSTVEEKIKQILPKIDLITFGMADRLWGEKLCLASTSNIQIEELRLRLDPILTPKEIFLFKEIPTTLLGKPDRKRALEIANEMKLR